MNENGSLIFMGLCLFLPMLIPIFIGSPEREPEIRYVETKPIYIKPKRKKVRPESKKIKQHELVKQKEEIDLKPEAIECLVSLGMKKSLAKEKVKTMWENKKYIDIESFLIDAYRL
jgi:hypothetical protein